MATTIVGAKIVDVCLITFFVIQTTVDINTYPRLIFLSPPLASSLLHFAAASLFIAMLIKIVVVFSLAAYALSAPQLGGLGGVGGVGGIGGIAGVAGAICLGPCEVSTAWLTQSTLGGLLGAGPLGGLTGSSSNGSPLG